MKEVETLPAKPPSQIGGENVCCQFLESRSCKADCAVFLAGPVPPKTTLHQPCQDCKELHVPPMKYLHQLAFTLRETISKLIIWIFPPLLFYFQSCFALISSLNTFTCSPSLLLRFSRQVCENRAFQKSQPTKVRV